MKPFRLALILAVVTVSATFVAIRAYPRSAANLIPEHPRMRKVCDLAGWCGNVEIECTRYDDTGNTTLRGDVWVRVSTIFGASLSGDGWYHADGAGYAVHGLYFPGPVHAKTAHEAYGLAVEAAINEWLHEYDEDHAPKSEDVVYPHAESCDKGCK